jgi:transposase
VPNRKLRCATCRTIRTEGHSFLDPYRRYTLRFERAVAGLCRHLPIKQVAEHFGLSWDVVKEIDKRRLEREVGTPCYDGLRRIAVDEVAIHKGHTYLTTVLDLDTGRIVWVGKGRTEATLASFFAELTPEQRRSIEAVASDMAAGFRNAVEKACPHAAQVYDLFHVVAKYSREVVDVVRLEEAKKQDEAGRKLIKGSRYLLLKNAPNLLSSQRKALRELLEANEALNTVYVLKDQLKRIWDYKRPAWARKALDQ